MINISFWTQDYLGIDNWNTLYIWEISNFFFRHRTTWAIFSSKFRTDRCFWLSNFEPGHIWLTFDSRFVFIVFVQNVSIFVLHLPNSINWNQFSKIYSRKTKTERERINLQLKWVWVSEWIIYRVWVSEWARVSECVVIKPKRIESKINLFQSLNSFFPVKFSAGFGKSKKHFIFPMIVPNLYLS